MIGELLYNKRLIVGLILFLIPLLLGTIGPYFYPKDPYERSMCSECPPSEEHLLGTDARGYDILAQIMEGILTSLYVGFLSATITMTIATVVGVIAGIKGGSIIDEVLMFIANIFMIIPSILLAILIAAYIRVRSLEVIALVMAIPAWGGWSKAIRSAILSLREREYIYLSKMAGYSDIRLAFEDLLPNLASYIIIAFMTNFAGAILTEASLSFIGLGPTKGITLGKILFWAMQLGALRRGVWWWFIPPGAIIIMICVALMLISTGLDEVFNPRLR